VKLPYYFLFACRIYWLDVLAPDGIYTDRVAGGLVLAANIAHNARAKERLAAAGASAALKFVSLITQPPVTCDFHDQIPLLSRKYSTYYALDKLSEPSLVLSKAISLFTIRPQEYA
jgi:hypothetical protein